jgi:hypothetical protein
VVTSTVTARAATAAPSTELVLVLHRVRAVVLTTRLIVAHVLRLSCQIYHCPLVTLMSSLRHDLVMRAMSGAAMSALTESLSEVAVASPICIRVLPRLAEIVSNLISRHFTLTAGNLL